MGQIRRIAIAALAALLLNAPAGWAGGPELSDRNAAVTIDDFSGQEDPVSFIWFVEELPWVSQRFTLVIGDEEILVPEFEPSDFQFTDTNTFVDPADDTLAIRYADEGFTLDISLMLRGGPSGSGVSDLAETIVITNDLSMDLFFIQQVGVLGFGDPSGAVVNDNTVRITGSGGLVLEEVVTPGWDSVSVGGSTFGFELGWSIAPGETLLISKDKRIFVPEPSAAALLGLGLAALTAMRRR